MNKKELVDELVALGSLVSKSSLLKMDKTSLEGLLATQKLMNQMQSQMEKLQSEISSKPSRAENSMEQEHKNSDGNDTIFGHVKSHNINAERRVMLQNLPDDKLVQVMNGTTGKLYWKSPVTGTVINLPHYGAFDDVSVKELKVMRNQSPKMLNNKNLIITDKEVAEAFGLREQYEDVMLPETLEEKILVFDDLNEFLKTASRQMQIVTIETAIRLYHRGKLLDTRTINLFQEKYNIYLEDTVMNDNVTSTY